MSGLQAAKTALASGPGRICAIAPDADSSKTVPMSELSCLAGSFLPSLGVSR
jgi:hypothetical protein